MHIHTHKGFFFLQNVEETLCQQSVYLALQLSLNIVTNNLLFIYRMDLKLNSNKDRFLPRGSISHVILQNGRNNPYGKFFNMISFLKLTYFFHFLFMCHPVT